jgi:hypothetical protein
LYTGKRGPSYIPSRSFAIALLDTLDGATTPSIARDAIAVLRRDAGDDIDTLRRAVEVWFNDSMERMSGWYKRRTQFISLLSAILITVGSNADTFKIAGTLWRDPSMRQAMVAQAQRYVAEQPQPGAPQGQAASSPDAPEPPPLPPYEQAQIDFDAASNRLDAARADLDAMQLPIGWRAPRGEAGDEAIDRFRLVRDDATEEWPGVIWNRASWSGWMAALSAHSLGWLITILAISVGAPFWFDMLNKIVSIRSVGKAPEESPKPPKDVPKPREPGEKP